MNKFLSISMTIVFFIGGFAAYGQNDRHAFPSVESRSIDDSVNDGQTPFVTTWKTDNPGGSDDNQIIIPGTGNNYSIQWEEVGNPDNNGTAIGNDETTLTFPHPGIYRISITGDFTRLQFTFTSGQKILSVDQWGDIAWENMEHAFITCYNLRIKAEDTPDLSRVTNLSHMFTLCVSMNDYIGDWDVSNVQSMAFMFQQAHDYNQPLEDWDVSNVTNMAGMFSSSSFDQPLENWDVSNVTNMGLLFASTPFNQPLEKWNVGSVTHMGGMFRDNTAFNQPINNWNVSRVNTFSSMFNGAHSFNQPLDNWNVASANRMETMFRNAVEFNQDISSWDVSQVESMSQMFFGAISFNQPIGIWDVSSVSQMSHMFRDAVVFNQPLDQWDVARVGGMFHMFDNAKVFDQNLGSWDLSGLIPWHNSLGHMFDHSGMSCKNYDLTLKGWNSNPMTPDDFELGAKGIGYQTAVGARDSLINLRGWTFIGDQFGLCDSIVCDLPLADIVILGDHPVCKGEEVTLFAQANGLQFHWIKNGEELDGVVDQSLIITEPGFFKVRYTDETGCVSEESKAADVEFLDESTTPVLLNGADEVLRSIEPNCQGFAFWEAEIKSCGDITEIENRTEWRIDIYNSGQYDLKSTDPRPDGSVRNNLQIEEELPFGSHRLEWTIRDNYGNQLNHSQIITLVDMNPPVPVCMHGISTSMGSSNATTTLPAAVFDLGSWDDCTNRDDLQLSFSSDPTHTHHTWSCDDLNGETQNSIPVQIWVTNEYGHQSHCNTYVRVRDTQNACASSIPILPQEEHNVKNEGNTTSKKNIPEDFLQMEKSSNMRFSTSSPYPNPFIDQTNISITIPESGQISLTLYDTYGQKILRKSDNYPAGPTALELNSSNFPSAGLYFYRIDYTELSISGRLLKVD